MTGDLIPQLFDGVRRGKRGAIGQTITLIESRKPEHQQQAKLLLEKLLPFSGGSRRIGISGSPGVGKSTFIESLGGRLTSLGHKVAVLAVDPSSGRTGGSILGDKTRMEQLATDKNAFIRPSPSSGVLGGVGRATQETILLLEAAGYDVVLVETVGTGQSETMVADMVDFFLVLMLPGSGDDLQGIKKGILELADMIAVNKADVFHEKLKHALSDYRSALKILKDASPSWHPPVMAVSGLTGQGLDDLWQQIEKHSRITEENGESVKKRELQRLKWMHRLLGDQILDTVLGRPNIKSQLPEFEQKVINGELTPFHAVSKLLEAVFK